MADVPKTLADGHTLLMLLAAKPADMKKPTVAEITAGKDISCRITKADFRLSATASETVDGTALCDEATVNVFGASNFEGTIAPFRYFNPEQPGQHDTRAEDDLTSVISSTADYAVFHEYGTRFQRAPRIWGLLWTLSNLPLSRLSVRLEMRSCDYPCPGA